jgi:hypothetical protein
VKDLNAGDCYIVPSTRDYYIVPSTRVKIATRQSVLSFHCYHPEPKGSSGDDGQKAPSRACVYSFTNRHEKVPVNE